MKNVQEFLAKAKENAQNKAIEMAKIELSVWDKNHETELIQNHGFTQSSLISRKKHLNSIANG